MLSASLHVKKSLNPHQVNTHIHRYTHARRKGEKLKGRKGGREERRRKEKARKEEEKKRGRRGMRKDQTRMGRNKKKKSRNECKEGIDK